MAPANTDSELENRFVELLKANVLFREAGGLAWSAGEIVRSLLGFNSMPDDLEVIAVILGTGDHREVIKYLQRSNRSISDGQKGALTQHSSLESLLIDSSSPGSSMNIFFRHADDELDDYVGRRVGAFSSYFDRLLDLPGRFRLARRGLIKEDVLPSGRRIVIKRENKNKKSRFINEQRAVSRLQQLKTGGLFDPVPGGSGTVTLSLLTYLAVLNDGGDWYSLSEKSSAPTVESILLTTTDTQERRSLLAEIGSILERLYQFGVIWGDFAPRNMLRETYSVGASYTLLDFEKTKFTPEPASRIERFRHARGPMCVEEFGAICSQEEVEFCFGAYFRPSKWNVRSQAPVYLDQPKSDYLDLLASRGNTAPTQGDYDEVELEVMGIRFPLTCGSTSRVLYPVHIGFRVDHYFAPDVEPRVVKILLFAKNDGLLDRCVRVLEGAVNQVDQELINAEWLGLIRGGTQSGEVSELPAGQAFLALVDQLSVAADRGDQHSFRRVLESID